MLERSPDKLALQLAHLFMDLPMMVLMALLIMRSRDTYAFNYPLTQNIALVPAFYWIGNPNNFSNNLNIYGGNLRAQFSL